MSALRQSHSFIFIVSNQFDFFCDFEIVLFVQRIGTCEFCGFFGVKEQFFSKSKRFCKVECAKKYSASNIKKRKTDRITPTKKRTVRKPAPSKRVCKFNKHKICSCTVACRMYDPQEEESRATERTLL